ncbi:MAG: NIL domain-containing protein [Deltaproteobacteria bacterium]|nr:NIL domain-containing protein [Deltaproteobacteria bacterium]
MKTKKTVRRKVYLTFPASQTKEAIICDMYDHYKVRFNIRSASVSEKIGLMAVEMEGPEEKIQKAFAYFKKRGLKVEPIEMTVVES